MSALIVSVVCQTHLFQLFISHFINFVLSYCLRAYTFINFLDEHFTIVFMERYNVTIPKAIHTLTLKVLVATIDAQWEGMGDVGSARYEPALLPPCPTIRVLSCSN